MVTLDTAKRGWGGGGCGVVGGTDGRLVLGQRYNHFHFTVKG